MNWDALIVIISLFGFWLSLARAAWLWMETQWD